MDWFMNLYWIEIVMDLKKLCDQVEVKASNQFQSASKDQAKPRLSAFKIN